MSATARTALSAFALVMVMVAAADAAPLAGDRYYGEVAGPRGGKIAVGVTPTADRQSFEPAGPRDWQGSRVVASRSLPCVGGGEWSVAGERGSVVDGSDYTVRRTARGGADTLRLHAKFAGRRATVQLTLRSTRHGGCVFRTRVAARVTQRLQGTCTPAHTTTLARSATGRIFAQRDAADLGGHTRNVYGCLFAEGKRFYLSQHEPPDDYVAAAATAGSLGAVAVYVCPADCGGAVEVVDLTTGQPARRDVVEPMCNQSRDQPPEVARLVLAASGSYAYVAGGYDDPPTAVKDVVKNVGGANTLLDCGTNIDSRSLSLTGTTLSWLNGGERQATPLE